MFHKSMPDRLLTVFQSSGLNSVASLSPRAEEAGVSAGGWLDGYYTLSERRQWSVTQW